MQEFFYKTVKYCFIGLICLVGLTVVFALFSDTDKPQVKRSVGQPKKADVEVQVQSLSDLRKQQDALIAKRQKIWDQQEALVVNDKQTDEKKYNALAEVETQLSKTIVGLSKKIVKAKNQQRVNAQAQVKKQFSGWDGSHRGLVAMIKKNMHDPKSFEHVETRFWILNNGAILRVQMTYRGNNAFGNPIIETVKADFDMDGNFIRIVE